MPTTVYHTTFLPVSPPLLAKISTPLISHLCFNHSLNPPSIPMSNPNFTCPLQLHPIHTTILTHRPSHQPTTTTTPAYPLLPSSQHPHIMSPLPWRHLLPLATTAPAYPYSVDLTTQHHLSISLPPLHLVTPSTTSAYPLIPPPTHNNNNTPTYPLLPTTQHQPTYLHPSTEPPQSPPLPHTPSSPLHPPTMTTTTSAYPILPPPTHTPPTFYPPSHH